MEKCCIISAVEIDTRNDITTITVADGVLANLCECQEVRIGVSTSFDVDRSCTRIEVTDGDKTLDIYCKNQHWRPKQLICNSVIVTEYKSDPELLVFKYGVRKGGVC